MITFTLPYFIAWAALANLLILLVGSVAFVYWVVKTVGILRAAKAGTLLDASIDNLVDVTIPLQNAITDKLGEQRELTMTLTKRVETLSERLTPQSLSEVLEARAGQLSWERIDLEKQQRLGTERQLKRIEKLVKGMTGTVAELAEAVREGLPNYLDPILVGRLESYCAQRGV